MCFQTRFIKISVAGAALLGTAVQGAADPGDAHPSNASTPPPLPPAAAAEARVLREKHLARYGYRGAPDSNVAPSGPPPPPFHALGDAASTTAVLPPLDDIVSESPSPEPPSTHFGNDIAITRDEPPITDDPLPAPRTAKDYVELEGKGGGWIKMEKQHPAHEQWYMKNSILGVDTSLRFTSENMEGTTAMDPRDERNDIHQCFERQNELTAPTPEEMFRNIPKKVSRRRYAPRNEEQLQANPLTEIEKQKATNYDLIAKEYGADQVRPADTQGLSTKHIWDVRKDDTIFSAGCRYGTGSYAHGNMIFAGYEAIRSLGRTTINLNFHWYYGDELDSDTCRNLIKRQRAFHFTIAQKDFKFGEKQPSPTCGGKTVYYIESGALTKVLDRSSLKYHGTSLYFSKKEKKLFEDFVKKYELKEGHEYTLAARFFEQ